VSKSGKIDPIVEIEFIPDEVYDIDKLALVKGIDAGICDTLPTANPRKGNDTTAHSIWKC